ncbi:hypothetical protein ABC502_04895 [Alkalimonas sp. NCh-2]|uniref:hypothetical protein n=1 Tax=Alkalimonas sp. NCh-2 TaxID=3144846 RepID=UPI0031F6033B
MKSSNSSGQPKILAGVSLAHAIKEKMGQDYHGLLPPHFALGMVALFKLAQLYSVLCILLGCVWLLLSQQSVHPPLLTALALSAIVAAAIAAFLFSTKGFKKMVCYQQRVLHIKQELLKKRTKSA